MQGDQEQTPNPSEAPVNANAERPPVRKPRVSSLYPLPSDRFAYEVHAEVLRKLNTLSSGGKVAVPAASVVGEGAPKQAAELNVRFWQAIGMVTLEEGKWKPTPETVQYVIARAAGPERARPVLNSIISKTWFADAAIRALATKPIMPREELEKDLAMVAQAPYDKRAPSMKVLVEYLTDAGIVSVSERGVAIGSGAGPGVTLFGVKDVEGVTTLIPKGDVEPGLAPSDDAGSVSPEAGAKSSRRTWWTRTGAGFVLQIEPSEKALKSLRKQLDFLDGEVRDLEDR